jgi:hypothetical protein
MSNSQEKTTIEAGEFVLRGRNGEVQARLHATDRGPEFTLFDARGQKRASIDVAGIRLFDSASQACVSMAILRQGAVIWLSDAKGEQKASLATFGGESFLSLLGPDGLSGVSLSIERDAPKFTLREVSGNLVSVAEVMVKGRTIRRPKPVESERKQKTASGSGKERNDEVP